MDKLEDPNQNPMLVFIHTFVTNDHLLSDECMSAIQGNKGTDNFVISESLLVCEKCGTTFINWMQLGQFRCPPKIRLSSVEMAQRGRTPSMYNGM